MVVLKGKCARSEKDITEASGASGTGSIPVGRTSFHSGDNLYKACSGRLRGQA